MSNKLKNSAKYRKTKKGILSSRKSNTNEKGKARGRKYFHSPKGQNRHYLNTFGLSLEDYNKLLKLQNGVCAICGGLDVEGKKLAVDHNHTTREIRALLCSSCNRGLGMFRDSEFLLEKAINYLKKYANN